MEDGLHERCSTRYCTELRYPCLQESMNINRVRISPYYLADSGEGTYAVVHSVAEKVIILASVWTDLHVHMVFCIQFLTFDSM